MSNRDIIEVDTFDIFTSEFMEDIEGDKPVVSNAFDQLFIPGNRIPKKILELMADADHAEQTLLLNEPLIQSFIEKPFWKSKRLAIEVLGTVCLTADRSLLDNVIAHGTLINNAEKYTLRQICEHPELNMKQIDWGAYKNQARIDKPLSNSGIYFHVPTSVLARASKKKLQKSFRNSMMAKLRRLRNMELRVTPEIDGELLTHKTNEIHLLGHDYHVLLDLSKMKGNDHNSDTFTDLIVNVDETYLRSIQEDGNISRKRVKHAYPHLVGPNSIEDFYKLIDSHKRSYIHDKSLSEFIVTYFDSKLTTFGINRSFKLKQMYKQVIGDQPKLWEHFGLKLQKVTRRNPTFNSNEDYLFYHKLTADRLNGYKDE
jgi:hypothetical protein|tara:strand:- start:2167 stop:3279 length:1113 start_codon:yes stop_codon:yes gene_type:complete